MKPFLLTLHRWLGFPVGLVFIVTFGTGCLTAVDELLKHLEHNSENATYQYRQTTPAEDASVLAAIIQDQQGIRQIVMPTPDTPYYRVVSRGESWTYAIDDPARVAHATTDDEGFFDTVLHLHRDLLLGREGLWGVEGKYYVAWTALIALLLSVVGFWLWWPRRKVFRARDIVPRGTQRGYFYVSHMTSGVVVLIVIVLLALTGASISYRAITQQLFGVERDKPPTLQPIALENHWQAWLEAAYAQMPDGSQLKAIRFPRQGGERGQRPGGTGEQTANNGRQQRGDQQRGDNQNAPQILKFRFLAPGDWLGIAGSEISIDKNASALTDISLFRELSPGEKIYAILVPLHTGRQLHWSYVAVLLAMSLLGTVMVLSGLVSFIAKKRQWPKFSRLTSARPLAD